MEPTTGENRQKSPMFTEETPFPPLWLGIYIKKFL